MGNAAPAAFSGVLESARSVFAGDPQTRKQVAFSIAIIALSAKMAKADGVVTQDEVDAFRDVFEVPQDQAANVARIYNLAKGDVAGFVAYAQQVKKQFPSDNAILEDVMDALFEQFLNQWLAPCAEGDGEDDRCQDHDADIIAQFPEDRDRT